MSEQRPSYWAVVPAAVRYDTEIPPNAKLLYAELSALADKNGYCFPSNAYLSEVFTLTDTSVRRLLRSLADHGYISIDVSRDSKTNEVISRSIYVGLNPLHSETPSAQKCTEGSVQKCAEASAQNCSAYIMNIKGNITNTPKAPSGGDSDLMFDRFWKAYPRKVNKQAARRAWKKLKPDLLLCTQMSIALKEQIKSDAWQREGGRFIPHPSTWLNGRRWEDELPTETPQRPPDTAKQEAWGWQT